MKNPRLVITTFISFLLVLTFMVWQRLPNEKPKPLGKGQLTTTRNKKPSVRPDKKAATELRTSPIGDKSPRFSPIDPFNREEQARVKKITSLSQSGQHLLAIELADKSLLESPSKDLSIWIQAQTYALLVNAAGLLMQKSDYQKAIEYLRRAEALRPEQPTVIQSLTYCYYQTERYGEAETLILLYKERFGLSRFLLGIYKELLESNDRYDEAASLLEEFKDDPSQSRSNGELFSLKKNIMALRRRAKESLFQRSLSTNEFVLTYHGEQHGELAREILDHLGRSLDELTDRLGFPYPQRKIEVILYNTKKFASLVPGTPSWAEGIFDGRIRVPVWAKTEKSSSIHRLNQVLRHELVHALFAQTAPQSLIPPWFNEGVAEWASCSPSPCSSAQRAPRNADAFLDVEDFLPHYTSYGKVMASRVYLQSLFLIEFLVKKFDREGLRKLITNIVRHHKALSSDELLKPLGLSFRQLVSQAKMDWLKTRNKGTP